MTWWLGIQPHILILLIKKIVIWGVEPTFEFHGSHWAPPLYRFWFPGEPFSDHLRNGIETGCLKISLREYHSLHQFTKCLHNVYYIYLLHRSLDSVTEALRMNVPRPSQKVGRHLLVDHRTSCFVFSNSLLHIDLFHSFFGKVEW